MNIIGNKTLKEQLHTTIDKNHVAHSNLFVHPEGIGIINFAIDYIANIFKKDLEKNKENIDIDKTLSNILKLNHPDIHYIFPTIGQKSKSINFIKEWKEFINKNPFGDLSDWHNHINTENKQSIIGIDDANYIKEIISLQPYERSYKAFIIWHSEKMNQEAANKLLKILEEQHNKTIFILLTINEEKIIPTIYSRTRKFYFRKISTENIYLYLKETFSKHSDIKLKNTAIIANGNINKSLKIIRNEKVESETLFIDWIRCCFKIKNSISEMQNIFNLSLKFKIAGREKQKNILLYTLEVFRNAFLNNHNIKNQNYTIDDPEFNFNNFSKHITQHNIQHIYTEINNSILEIQRNLSPELTFTNLSLNISRFIHRK